MMSKAAGSNLIPGALTRIRLDVRWYYPRLSSNPNRTMLVKTTQRNLTGGRMVPRAYSDIASSIYLLLFFLVLAFG